MTMRWMLACGVAASLTAATLAAQDHAQAHMRVSATVVPHCRISVSGPGAAAITVSCAASRLRSLRATPSRGYELLSRDGRQLRAGGDRVFLLSRGAGAGPDALVTLDF